MITLGVILLILGLVFKAGIVWALGVVLLIIGAILMLIGSAGRTIGGRAHYY